MVMSKASDQEVFDAVDQGGGVEEPVPEIMADSVLASFPVGGG